MSRMPTTNSVAVVKSYLAERIDAVFPRRNVTIDYQSGEGFAVRFAKGTEHRGNLNVLCRDLRSIFGADAVKDCWNNPEEGDLVGFDLKGNATLLCKKLPVLTAGIPQR